MYGGCWSTYIHKRPNIGNALRGLFTEKDGSNKTRTLSHMSLGVISTNQVERKKERKKRSSESREEKKIYSKDPVDEFFLILRYSDNQIATTFDLTSKSK